MPEAEAGKRSIMHKILVFFMRLCGYGILFVFLFMVVGTVFFRQNITAIAERDEIALHFDGFSLSTPNPAEYWSWQAPEPERYLVKSDRMDTLLIQRSFSSTEDCVAVGLKNGKTMAYLLWVGSMNRIVANDANVYMPRIAHAEYFNEDTTLTNRLLDTSMERLAERVGAQGIQDLLTLSRSYIRDTHASRDLLFASDRIAKGWNRLHPDAAIKIPDVPKSDSYEMLP